jgi:phage shock protein PspC (stress-responsive transcriptional regulator)
MTMRTVNTISLNGNAWQIEADGCQALGAYLKGAETRLTADPDRDEILADLEQAIADKLSRHVNAHKNVVTAAEIALVLQEMGPVEAGTAGADAAKPAGAAGMQSAADADTGGAPGAAAAMPGWRTERGADTRRLYQIREGAMLSGVCKGLAAYFGIDATLVRVMFVVFTVLTGGIGGAVYLVMMIVVPVAATAEQMAQAHGKPFNAEELIGRPQAAFTAGAHWRQQWRDQRRMWREERRQWRRQHRGWHGPMAPPPPPPPPFGWQSAPYAGHFGPGLALLQALLLIAFLVCLMGAISGRPLMGWDWTSQVPHWVGIVAVCVIYGTLSRQVRMARYYGHVGAYNPAHALLALLGTVVWLTVLVACGWYAAHHWPEVQDFLQRALQAIQAAFGDGSAHTTVST